MIEGLQVMGSYLLDIDTWHGNLYTYGRLSPNKYLIRHQILVSFGYRIMPKNSIFFFKEFDLGIKYPLLNLIPLLGHVALVFDQMCVIVL